MHPKVPSIILVDNTSDVFTGLIFPAFLKVKGCDYVFHVEGSPLNYGTIQINYRGAQRKGKLPYSGTHILRHGMAKLARKVGGLDAVMAMTGHKDIKLADHYSKCTEDDQKEVSKKIFEKIRSVQSTSESEAFANVLSLSDFAKNA
jgi:integrase